MREGDIHLNYNIIEILILSRKLYPNGMIVLELTLLIKIAHALLDFFFTITYLGTTTNLLTGSLKIVKIKYVRV